MAEGRLEEVLTWLRQLEEDAGVAPVWEVLFQAMCCPVPQASVQCPPYMPWWQASRALPVGLVFLLCTLAYAGIQAYAARCHAMPPAAAAAPGDVGTAAWLVHCAPTRNVCHFCSQHLTQQAFNNP